MNQQINEEQNTIDRGVSDITSFDLLEQPSEFKTALDEAYRVEDEVEESDPRFFQSAVPGVLTALTTDNLSAINLLNPLVVLNIRGLLIIFPVYLLKAVMEKCFFLMTILILILTLENGWRIHQK